MHVKTLLPEKATLTTVGGPGKEFVVNGKNYSISAAYIAKSVKRGSIKSFQDMVIGHWRMEVTPPPGHVDDTFLHVIEVGKKDKLSSMHEVKFKQTDSHYEIDLDLGIRKAKVMLHKTDPLVGSFQLGAGESMKFKATIQAQKGLALKK